MPPALQAPTLRGARFTCRAGGTRQEVLEGRFGTPETQRLLTNAYRLQDIINAEVVGQAQLAKALQDRVVLFLESLGKRRQAPLALHIVGLPGVGKSASLKALEKIGLDVVHINAHVLSGATSPGEAIHLFSRAMLSDHHTPRIVVFDELDKMAELGGEAGRSDKPHPFMGLFNQLLTDGTLRTHPNVQVDLSHICIITAMNFAPAEIKAFSPQVLGHSKDFCDFSVEDFAAFDVWLRQRSAPRSKVLSSIFQANTVGRLAPNTVIVRPLGHADYRTIIQRHIDLTLRQFSSGSGEKKKVQVTYDSDYIDYLAKRIVYAPSGARETTVKAALMTEQLCNFATKKQGSDPASLVQPRAAHIAVARHGHNVVVRVTATKSASSPPITCDEFTFEVAYDTNTQAFVQPEGLAVCPPMARTSERPPVTRPPTRKQISAARFPVIKNEVTGLAEKINAQLIGQETYTERIENELNAYMGRPGPVHGSPPFMIIAGFPGIGKSALVDLAGRYSGLPVARLNLQAYAATDADTMSRFINDLENGLTQARQASNNGKYILLLEELDKAPEVAKNGDIVNQPMMNYIKDLLNEGVIRTTLSQGNGYTEQKTLDIRDAYNVVTMNFGVDRFNFTADPRLTTLEDMTLACERLRQPAELRGILASMFLTETVNRLLPRFLVMRPLKREAYETIIGNQVKAVLQNRFYDTTTRQNTGQIEVALTPAYRQYLYSEAVIPSEGARNAVLTTEDRLSLHLEEMIKCLPDFPDMATVPLTITLNYHAATTEVSAMAVRRSEAHGFHAKQIYRRKVILTFPPLSATPPFSEKRVITCIHELGHCVTGVRLGRRFEHVVVSPQGSTGGFVKYRRHSGSARDIIADIYIALGSRAMERIFLSPHPKAPNSVLDITAGASSDIEHATASLWNVLYRYGFDSLGGPIERIGKPFAHFDALPDKAVESMQRILRQMEDYLVDDLMRAHPKSWYQERIKHLAHVGTLNEREVYNLLNYSYAGDAHNEASLAPSSLLRETFGEVLEPVALEVLQARSFRQGLTSTTAQENLDAAMKHFDLWVQATHTELPEDASPNHGKCSTDESGDSEGEPLVSLRRSRQLKDRESEN